MDRIRELLKGKYKIQNLPITDSKNLFGTLSQIPVAFHLYKRRDFKTKAPNKVCYN